MWESNPFAAELRPASARAMIAGMRAMRLPSNGWWRQVLLYGGLFAFVCAWMVLLGPASEWLTYLLLAPAAALAVVASTAVMKAAFMLSTGLGC